MYILIWTLRPLKSIWCNGTFILNETYHAPNGSLSKVGVGGKSKFVILNPLNGFGWKSRLFCGKYWFSYLGRNDLSGLTMTSASSISWPLLVRRRKIWPSPNWKCLNWKCNLDLDKRVRLNRRPFNPGLIFVWTNQSRIFIKMKNMLRNSILPRIFFVMRCYEMYSEYIISHIKQITSVLVLIRH